MENAICTEFNRLRNLENKELEKIVKHAIPETHLGKEDSIASFLISKFGYSDVCTAVRQLGLTA